MTPELQITPIHFKDAVLDSWRRRRGSLLKLCPRRVEAKLRVKANNRRGRRFFGEAFVLAKSQCRDGWYGSFKWLTSPRWSGNRKLPNSYQEHFREALTGHFPRLAAFQEKAGALGRKHRVGRPVGPDLWLITPRAHRFVEVKLPKDRVRDTQLAGLALIGALLKGDRPVQIEVVLLYSGKKPDKQKQKLEERFENVVSKLRLRRA